MKISNSKKELARIISENGGWRDGADTCSCDNDGYVNFFVGNPTRSGGSWLDNGDCEYIGGIITPKYEKIKNWHQTILSREEYFNLYQAPDVDGWIECGGGGIPVGFGTLVDVKLRGGNVELGQQFTFSDSWGNHGGALDIIAYRLHRPEQAKPKFCDSVMRSIPEPEINSKNINITQVDDIDVVESKPTIEQLAADYRAKLAIATQAKEEADSHRCGAEVALSKLEIAAKELGFKIEPITTKQEPELVIAVQVGDEVECIESNVNPNKYRGMIGTALVVDDTSTPYLVDFGNEARIWCHEVKFIRRP